MQFKNQQKLTAVASKSQATTTSGIAKKFVKIMASFCSGRRSGSLGFRGLRIGTPNGGVWEFGGGEPTKTPQGSARTHTHTHTYPHSLSNWRRFGLSFILMLFCTLFAFAIQSD